MPFWRPWLLAAASAPGGEAVLAGMRGAETVEAGEGARPGEIRGKGPDLLGSDGTGRKTRMPRPGADQAKRLAAGNAELLEQRRRA